MPFLIWFLSLFSACEIHFDNTPVPVENVLGNVGGGFKVKLLLCYDNLSHFLVALNLIMKARLSAKSLV